MPEKVGREFQKDQIDRIIDVLAHRQLVGSSNKNINELRTKLIAIQDTCNSVQIRKRSDVEIDDGEYEIIRVPKVSVSEKAIVLGKVISEMNRRFPELSTD